MIRPWKQTSTRHAGDFHIFRVRRDEKISPRTENPHSFFIMECLDWVNVLAITPDQQMVMVEQFRHGTNTVELEIPGGMLNSASEDPVEAGLRELREETGYEGNQSQLLCSVMPNPAFMTNRCHTVLVQNCELKHALEWDSGEDIITRLVPVQDIPNLVASGKIRHSVILAALYHFHLWQEQDSRPKTHDSSRK